jgi:hypothetical protein
MLQQYQSGVSRLVGAGSIPAVGAPHIISWDQGGRLLRGKATMMRRICHSGLRSCFLAALLGVLWWSSAPAQPDPYTTVGLHWTATGDDGYVGTASAYRLRYSTNSVGIDTTSWWNNATPVSSGLPTPSPSGSSDSTSVTGLQVGTTYYFIIRAVDDGLNESGFSNVAVKATASCATPSSTPQQFQAVEDSTSGNVMLSWVATTDPLAAQIHVYRAVGSGGMTLLASLAASATSYQDQTTNPDATYRYRAAWAATCGPNPATGEGPMTPVITIQTGGNKPPKPAKEPVVHTYPNPSRGPVQVVLNVTGTEDQAVLLRLYDLSGHWIATPADGSYSPGQHQLTWTCLARDGARVAPGLYELLGTIGSTKVRERIVLLP